jgi:drug/metabolite transporter (DMT)-like permease
MKGRLALVAAILLWSTSPTVVVGFRQAMPPDLAAAFVVVCACAMSLLAGAVLRREVFRELFDIRPDRALAKAVLMSILAYVLYPLLYFTGLHLGSPVEANVVNYTWPVIAVVVAMAMRSTAVSAERLGGIAAAFCGAVVAIVSLRSVTAPHTPLWVRDSPLIPYLMAFGGALCYGIYTALVDVVTIKRSSGEKIGNDTLFLLLLSLAAAVHVIIVIAHLVGAPMPKFSITPRRLLFLVIYAAANLALAHFLWLSAVRSLRLTTSTVTVFLTPVFGTILLSVSQGIRLSTGVSVGLALILTGIYLSRRSKTSVSPLVATFLAMALATAVSVYYRSTLPVDERTIPYFHLLEVVATVFAILSGFLLARAIQQADQTKKLLLDAQLRLRELIRDYPEATPQYAAADQYRCRLLDEFCETRADHMRQIRELTDSSFEALERLFPSPTSEVSHLLGATDAAVCEWRVTRSQGVSNSEWAIMWILIGSMSVLLFTIPASDTAMLVGRIACFSAFILILAAIREYTRGTADANARFIALVNGLFPNAASQSPYLPRVLLEPDTLSRAARVAFDAVRTRDDKDAVVSVPLPRDPEWRVSAALIASIAVLVVFAALQSL